jgi:hypothetical protein
MEALAMLTGFNSAPFLSFFAGNMMNYSDNGRTYNAFYGERLVNGKWGNQLHAVIRLLSKDPDSRQAVAQMWDPADLEKMTKDKACNMSLIFEVDQHGRLCMTSFNRSNDAIWGIVTGANVVHLSMFQEYVACALGREIGSWTHVSNNLHIYTEQPKWQDLKDLSIADSVKHHGYPFITCTPLFANVDNHTSRATFDLVLSDFIHRASQAVECGTYMLFDGILAERIPFIHKTAYPVFMAWHERKKKTGNVNYWLDRIESADWHVACKEWVERRNKSSDENPI